MYHVPIVLQVLMPLTACCFHKLCNELASLQGVSLKDMTVGVKSKLPLTLDKVNFYPTIDLCRISELWSFLFIIYFTALTVEIRALVYFAVSPALQTYNPI